MKGVWVNENALERGGAHWSPKVVPFLAAIDTQEHSVPSSRTEANDRGPNRPQTTPQITPRSDPDLDVIADAWPGLPEALKAAVMAIVRSASGGSGR